MKLLRFAFSVFLLATLFANARDKKTELKYITDSLPSRWEYHPSADGRVITIDDKWWTNFEDALLDSLVEAGLKANYDVKTALHNMLIAQNTYKSARSAYFPTITAQAGWEKNRISGITEGRAGKAMTRSYWNGELGLSWQIDLFGQITAQAKSKKALWQVSQAQWAGMMLSVAGEIVNEYISLRTAQMQLALVKQHAESQLSIVKMTEARKEAGVSSLVNVAQAKSLYYSTLSSVPTYENTVRSCLNALATLLGIYPDQLPLGVNKTPESLPSWQQMIAAGIPMDLLRRRPDVIEAERTIASYAAQLGLAKRDFLPILTLEGTISTSAMNISDVFTKPSIGYTIAPTLNWTFYTGGELTYELRSARESLQSGIDSYNNTIQTAVEDMNNSLSSYYTSLQQINLMDETVEWTKKALNLSIDLYKDGLASFTNVLDSQEDLLEYEITSLTARSDALTSLVKIYMALGGGWDSSNIK